MPLNLFYTVLIIFGLYVWYEQYSSMFMFSMFYSSSKYGRSYDRFKVK
jgi:hypothetical protein